MDTQVVVALGAWGSATNMDCCGDNYIPFISFLKKGGEEEGAEIISLICNSLWPNAF